MNITAVLTSLAVFMFIMGTTYGQDRACSAIADCTTPDMRLAITTLNIALVCKQGPTYVKCVDDVMDACKNENKKKQIAAMTSRTKRLLENCPKPVNSTDTDKKLKNVWCSLDPELAFPGECEE